MTCVDKPVDAQNNQFIHSIRWTGSVGINSLYLSARYNKIDPDSHTVTSLPSGPFGSLIAGILPLGQILKYSCLWFSAPRIWTVWGSYLKPLSSSFNSVSSSSAIATLIPKCTKCSWY